jgi:hypothetical protein
MEMRRMQRIFLNLYLLFPFSKPLLPFLLLF